MEGNKPCGDLLCTAMRTDLLGLLSIFIVKLYFITTFFPFSQPLNDCMFNITTALQNKQGT